MVLQEEVVILHVLFKAQSKPCNTISHGLFCKHGHVGFNGEGLSNVRLLNESQMQSMKFKLCMQQLAKFCGKESKCSIIRIFPGLRTSKF